MEASKASMSLVTLISLLTCLVLLLSGAGRVIACVCVCTPSHEATPVYRKSDSLSEIVGHISTNTCLHGELVKGKDWLLLLGSSYYYIKIKKLIACPNDRVEIEPNIIRMPKRTEANHNTDHKRFLLDSINQAQCNFDVNSFCSWRNVHGLDDFDWVLYGSSTPTDDTGPDFDHTTRNSSGSYIFTESSAPRNFFDTAWIQSPTIEVTSDPVHCFRFWYHMYGSSIGRLNVYQVTNGGLPGKFVWSLTGDQGNSWKEGQVPLNSNQSYSILLSGVIGNGYQGDIAVDDINVSVGYCEVKPSSASRTDVKNTTTTPVNGHWSAWGSWTACSVSCDIGQHTRYRTCEYDKVAPHGARCSGQDREMSFCSISYCPRDGVWTGWSQWSTCSATCGDGLETRGRKCVNPVPAAPLGKACEESVNEIQTCTNTTDCPVDGYWSEWASWSTCSVTCGHGDRSRNRTCLFEQGKPRGHDCVGQGLQTGSCTESDCPVDGVWNTWAAWSICNVTCGGGTKHRMRDCYFPSSAPPGLYCIGELAEKKTCNENSCPVERHVTELVLTRRENHMTLGVTVRLTIPRHVKQILVKPLKP
ncbi:properdin-like isoform X2 [Dreissena polymorpha]|uniref:properdin-like isoform X2 n=1 Tax=Dreissena polymorpha TaxID=45954 RepID=UPI002263C760|nr:properdin-like isoform X2 [Dreissena polymorpha]